jgi:hypothetical protein
MAFEDGTDRYVGSYQSVLCKYQNAKDLVHGICWLAEDLRRQLVCGNMFVLFTSVLYSGTGE